jgi:hypothetical protein
LIVALPSIPEFENDKYGSTEINVCCSAALEGSATAVPELQLPLPAEVTAPPEPEGTHKVTDETANAELTPPQPHHANHHAHHTKTPHHEHPSGQPAALAATPEIDATLNHAQPARPSQARQPNPPQPTPPKGKFQHVRPTRFGRRTPGKATRRGSTPHAISEQPVRKRRSPS